MSANSTKPAATNTTAEQELEVLASLVFGANKGASLGPYMLGLIFNTVFCGILVVQTIQYMSHTQDDRRVIRLFVYATVLMSLAYSVYLVAYVMKLFVFQFGLYAPFADVKGLVPFIILETAIAVTVQVFYSERTYRLLGKSKWFAAGALVLILAEAGTNIKVAVTIFAPEGTYDKDQAVAVVYAWLSLHLAVDLYITFFMGWALLRSRKGLSSTNRLLTRLVMFTVETQTPPLIIALVYLVLYAQQDGTATYYIGVNFVLPLPYAIGMLAVLNARDSLRKDLDTELTDRKPTDPNVTAAIQQATVHISTETYVHSSPAGMNNPFVPYASRQDASDDDLKIRPDSPVSSTGKGQLGNDSYTHLTEHQGP